MGGRSTAAMRAPRTTFVGRDAELTGLVADLAEHRLVTITGPAGVGKTRLALELAAPQPSLIVDLTPVPREESAGWAFLEAAGPTAGAPPGDPVAALAAQLADASVLLVVDNCEHISKACADAVDTLLDRCPGLTVLATSRQPLGVSGEAVRPIGPLDATATRQLFIDRARAAGAGVDVGMSSPAALDAICSELEGIPLAVELVAAWAPHLSLDDIVARLDDRLRLPARDTRHARHRTLAAALDWSFELLDDTEKRCFTRLAVFPTGADLASVGAVCADGRGSEPETLGVLASLVDKSLVVAMTRTPSGATRYRQLETVRRYALDRLCAAGDEPAARRAHAVWFARRAEESGNPAGGADHDDVDAAIRWALASGDGALACRLAASWRSWEVRGRLREGRELLAAAVDADPGPATQARVRARTGAATLSFAAGDHVTARRLHEENLADLAALGDRRGAAATRNGLAMVALYSGDRTEAERLGRQALAEFAELGDRSGEAFALSSLGMLAAASGDEARAAHHFLGSLALLRALGQKADAARVLANLGNLAHDHGDLARAYRFYEGGLQLSRELDDRRGAALALNNLGIVALKRGDAARAFALTEEALALFRSIDDAQGAAATLNNLGNLWSAGREPAQAMACYQESLRTFRTLQDPRGEATSLRNLGATLRDTGDLAQAWECALGALTIDAGSSLVGETGEDLELLAGLAAATERHETALLALGAAAALRPDGGDAAGGLVEQARGPVARARADALVTEGRQAGARAVLEHIRSLPPPDAPRHPAGRPPSTGRALTPRESEVAALVGAGLSNREIADRLYVSERTVDSHLTHIRSKLGVDSRTKLAVWAVEHGLVGRH